MSISVDERSRREAGRGFARPRTARHKTVWKGHAHAKPLWPLGHFNHTGRNPQLSAFWRQRRRCSCLRAKPAPCSRVATCWDLSRRRCWFTRADLPCPPAAAEQEKALQEEGKGPGLAQRRSRRPRRPATNIVATGVRGLRLLMQPRVVKQLALTAEQKREAAGGRQAVRRRAGKRSSARRRRKGNSPATASPPLISAGSGKPTKSISRRRKRSSRPSRPARSARPRWPRTPAIALPGVSPRAHPAQNDQLRRLSDEDRNRHSGALSEQSDKKLAVLTPQQRVQLRTEILEKGLPQCQGEWGIKVKGEHDPLWIYTLHPYADFSKEQVQKELSLTAAQQSKVRAILGR